MNDAMITSLRHKAEKSKHVCIFIDLDNIYYSLKQYGFSLTDDKTNMFRVLREIYGDEKIRCFRAYADYEHVKIPLSWLQKQRVQVQNVYSNGAGETRRKNASDIELSVDAIEAACLRPELDTFVLVTSDSDMLPVANRLLFRGRTVHLYFVGWSMSGHSQAENMCTVMVDLLRVMGIDADISSFLYLAPIAQKMVNTWYADERNKDKTLGAKWIKDMFCSQFSLTRIQSNEFLRFLVSSGVLEEWRDDAGNIYYHAIENEERQLPTT